MRPSRTRKPRVDETNCPTAKERLRLLGRIEALVNEDRIPLSAALKAVELRRSTYYDWRKALNERGVRGLVPKSRRPRRCSQPRWTKRDERRVLAVRDARPYCGKRRIHHELKRCRRPAELPGLAAALFGALRRDGRSELAERLSDALMRMLVVRFGGDETGAGHKEELRRALRHMEEPRMLAETVAQWRREALDEGRRMGMSEGRRQGMSEGMLNERALLRRQAARRFGVATGDALAALLANEEDVERLAEVGDLVVGCASAEELLRRGRGLLNGGS